MCAARGLVVLTVVGLSPAGCHWLFPFDGGAPDGQFHDWLHGDHRRDQSLVKPERNGARDLWPALNPTLLHAGASAGGVTNTNLNLSAGDGLLLLAGWSGAGNPVFTFEGVTASPLHPQAAGGVGAVAFWVANPGSGLKGLTATFSGAFVVYAVSLSGQAGRAVTEFGWTNSGVSPYFSPQPPCAMMVNVVTLGDSSTLLKSDQQTMLDAGQRVGAISVAAGWAAAPVGQLSWMYTKPTPASWALAGVCIN